MLAVIVRVVGPGQATLPFSEGQFEQGFSLFTSQSESLDSIADVTGTELRESAPHATGTARLYDIRMMMKSAFLATAFSAAILLAAPVSAADTQRDGQLPMYPHGVLDAKESSLTPAAIAHGVPLVLLTSDSVPVVDGWYSSHLPKECGRQPASGGVKFACPGGSIMVYPHDGKTQIALVPPMLGL